MCGADTLCLPSRNTHKSCSAVGCASAERRAAALRVSVLTVMPKCLFRLVTSLCPVREMDTGHPGQSVARALRVLELIFKPEIPIIWFVLLATRSRLPQGPSASPAGAGIGPIHRSCWAEHRKMRNQRTCAPGVRAVGLRTARKPR